MLLIGKNKDEARFGSTLGNVDECLINRFTSDSDQITFSGKISKCPTRRKTFQSALKILLKMNFED